jgi:hypothetical protein
LATLLLAIIIGVVVCRPNRPTAEERPFVGTWRLRPGSRGYATLTLSANHQCVRRVPAGDPSESTGRWWVRDGTIFLDFEPNPIRRAFRPLLEWLRLPVYAIGSTSTADFRRQRQQL